MKKLKVDIEELALAMDSRDLFYRYFFDVETGEIIFVTDDDEYDEFEFDDERFEPIPSLETWEAYNLRVEFAETRKNIRLKESLLSALSGKGAFGRFKRTLENYSEEELEQWYKFEQEFLNAKVLEWLHELSIEPTNE